MAAGGKQYTLKWITACVFEKWYYTDAWANANCFANYWGVDTVYRTHKNFSKNLKKGDVVNVRGKGKFLYEGTQHITKKDKCRISVQVYG